MAYYTCLLLDADNTLLDFDAAERKALADTLIHYDLPHDEAALDTYHQVNRRLWDSLAKGELNKNRLFAIRFGQYLKAMGLPDNGKGREMNEFYEDLLSTHADLLPGALTALDELGRSRHAGHRLQRRVQGAERPHRRFRHRPLYGRRLYLGKGRGLQAVGPHLRRRAARPWRQRPQPRARRRRRSARRHPRRPERRAGHLLGQL